MPSACPPIAVVQAMTVVSLASWLRVYHCQSRFSQYAPLNYRRPAATADACRSLDSKTLYRNEAKFTPPALRVPPRTLVSPTKHLTACSPPMQIAYESLQHHNGYPHTGAVKASNYVPRTSKCLSKLPFTCQCQ